MKNLQKGFASPILIIIAMLVIGGGLYVYQKNKRGVISTPNQPTTNSMSRNNISNDLNKTTSTPTSDQKTTPNVNTATNNTMPEPAVVPVKNVDCGNQPVSDIVGAMKALALSTCYNQHFNSCTPATFTVLISGVMTTKYAIVGKSDNLCKVIETVTGPKLPQATILSCLFDNTKDFSIAGSDFSKCIPQ
jgi:hypothetical protein